MADDRQLFSWIKEQYLSYGFSRVNFIGWKRFRGLLISKNPSQAPDIVEALGYLRKRGHADSLQTPDQVSRIRKLASRDERHAAWLKNKRGRGGRRAGRKGKVTHTHGNTQSESASNFNEMTEEDAVTRKMEGLEISEEDAITRKMKGLEI